MIVPMFICLYLGIKLSKLMKIDFIVVIFLLLGMVVAFRNVYHLTKKMYMKDKIEESKKQKYFDDMRKERERKLKELNVQKKTDKQ